MIQVFASDTVAFRDQKYVLPYLFSYIFFIMKIYCMYLLLYKNPWNNMILFAIGGTNFKTNVL